MRLTSIMLKAKHTRIFRTRLRDWYLFTYPDDPEWRHIRPDATFYKLVLALDAHEEGYDTIFKNGYVGYVDSVIRERIFGALTEMLGVVYDVVYYAWLGDEPPADRLRIVIDMRKEI